MATVILCGLLTSLPLDLLIGRHSAETHSIGAAIVMLIATFTTGHVAMWALISVGLFHSVMFPTIFTLGIKGLGPMTEEGARLAALQKSSWTEDTFIWSNDFSPFDRCITRGMPVSIMNFVEGTRFTPAKQAAMKPRAMTSAQKSGRKIT